MSQRNSRVSVVVPFGKLQGNVLRCVKTALHQSHVPHEVIVVANRGVSIQQARDLLGVVVDSPLLHIVDGTACRTANDARNMGASNASSEWIALLDSDDWWEPDHLETALNVALRVSAPVDFVYGSIRVHGIFGTEELAAEHFTVEHTPENYLLAYRPAQTSTYLVSRSLMLSQPWEASLRRHQDYEWFARITKQCRSGVNEAVKVNVEWLEQRNHHAHRDCWSVVAPWRAAVSRPHFRRHHRNLIKSALRSRDAFALQLLLHYMADSLRPPHQFLNT